MKCVSWDKHEGLQRLAVSSNFLLFKYAVLDGGTCWWEHFDAIPRNEFLSAEYCTTISTLRFMNEEEKTSLNCAKCQLVWFLAPAVSLFSSSTGLYWMYKRHWYQWPGCLLPIPLHDEKEDNIIVLYSCAIQMVFKIYYLACYLLHYISLFLLGDEHKGNWLYCSEPDWLTRLYHSLSSCLMPCL